MNDKGKDLRRKNDNWKQSMLGFTDLVEISSRKCNITKSSRHKIMTNQPRTIASGHPELLGQSSRKNETHRQTTSYIGK